MRVLFGTSVLVAAVVEAHPMHARALPWLQRAKARAFDAFVASHSIAELYAVLTTMPIRPRIAPAMAWRLVEENVEGVLRVVTVSPTDYRRVVKRLSELALVGGITYDALIARAAQKSRADSLLTFNIDDFFRVWPEGHDIIAAP